MRPMVAPFGLRRNPLELQLSASRQFGLNRWQNVSAHWPEFLGVSALEFSLVNTARRLLYSVRYGA